MAGNQKTDDGEMGFRNGWSRAGDDSHYIALKAVSKDFLRNYGQKI